MSAPAHRFLVWGTFDTGKPRVRMLIEALRLEDPALPVCHRDLWTGIEDKSQVKGLGKWIALMARWLLAYPMLLLAYLRAPSHRIVVVPYPGILDVLVLWPLARLRGASICWDMFLSLYDTTVIDRCMVHRSSIPARLLYAVEWIATRAADRILLDTRAHADHVASLFRLSPAKMGSFWVGAETELFTRSLLPADNPTNPSVLKVLFYGQFIPLHGLDTIVAAIEILEQQEHCLPIEFTIVGTGQEAIRIDALIATKGLQSISRIGWIEYSDLPQLIGSAAICLGIFAPEGKGLRVIPNKVFQILAMARPLVTMDSPAIREVVSPGPAIRLVTPGDPASLASAITDLAQDYANPCGALALHQAAATTMPRIGPQAVCRQFISATETL